MLRDGRLNGAALQRSSLTQTALEFYAGSFYAFYARWLRERCTMLDSGRVLAALKEHATANIGVMLSQASHALKPPGPSAAGA